MMPRNKLTPLGAKVSPKSIGKSDYQAYSEHSNIVPYPEKIIKLEQTDKHEKLSFLLNSPSGGAL